MRELTADLFISLDGFTSGAHFLDIPFYRNVLTVLMTAMETLRQLFAGAIPRLDFDHRTARC
jgi:hypothetical protein